MSGSRAWPSPSAPISKARAFARTRVQGRPVGADAAAPILHHPDVRRMLLSMRAASEAARALAYYTAATTDRARHDPDAAARARAQRRVDLLIPVVKAWSTDIGLEAASTNIQVHGGMGFIEETGAAQHFRDARIALIYEGTNGVQATGPRRPQARARPGRGGARAHRRDARLRRRARGIRGRAGAAARAASAPASPRSTPRPRCCSTATRRRRRGARRIGALSQADGHRRRRLADGEERARGRAATRRKATATHASPRPRSRPRGSMPSTSSPPRRRCCRRSPAATR